MKQRLYVFVSTDELNRKVIMLRNETEDPGHVCGHIGHVGQNDIVEVTCEQPMIAGHVSLETEGNETTFIALREMIVIGYLYKGEQEHLQ